MHIGWSDQGKELDRVERTLIGRKIHPSRFRRLIFRDYVIFVIVVDFFNREKKKKGWNFSRTDEIRGGTTKKKWISDKSNQESHEFIGMLR